MRSYGLEFLNRIEKKGFQTTTFAEIAGKKLAVKDLQNKLNITFDDYAAELLKFLGRRYRFMRQIYDPVLLIKNRLKAK